MTILHEAARSIYARVLAHGCDRVRTAVVWHEPFAHMYFEDFFPADVYDALLAHLPVAERYIAGPSGKYARPEARTCYHLTANGVQRLPEACRNLWRGVAAALTAPELKRCLYVKLAPGLMRRYGVKEAKVGTLAGYSRPTLYRDTAGYEIAPHPDTLKKIVTMHLYLPSDLSQLDLGTAIYERAAEGFTTVRQFEFRPNSGYAFAVSPISWHGRERLPADVGVRQSLFNTFYEDSRAEYAGYLEE